jgi:UPF0176 protein
MNEFTILLFYKYVFIEDPKKLRDEQRALCEKLGLKGRIITAPEGINVTIEGTNENVEKYLKEYLSDPRFSDTHIKRSKGTGSAFPKLSVKARKEIVTLGKDYNSIKTKGKVIKPEELKEWFKTKKVGEDFYIVDLRNDYEFKVGKFKGSVLPDLQNFRDVPKVLHELKDMKDKPIITVCTGDVRCEKASAYLQDEGFENAYHLDGGIVTYMEKFPAQEFEGSLYVFDGRILTHFDSPESHVVIGTCEKCETKSERYVNCKNPKCNKHFICCESCSEVDGKSFCSVECRDKILQYL